MNGWPFRGSEPAVVDRGSAGEEEVEGRDEKLSLRCFLKVTTKDISLLLVNFVLVVRREEENAEGESIKLSSQAKESG